MENFIAKTTGKQETFTNKFDILGNLPEEIVYEILLYLSEDDFINSFHCCKRWQQLMNYEFLWKTMHEKFYFNFIESNTECYKKVLRSYPLYWQGRFMYDRSLQFNFENDIFQSIPVQLNEQGTEWQDFSSIYFDNHILVLSNTVISTLLVINTSTGLIKNQFVLLDYVQAIKHGDFLIAITRAFNLKIWNIETGECITDITKNRYKTGFIEKLLACKHLIIIKRETLEHQLLYLFDMNTNEFSYLGDSLGVGCTNDIIAISNLNGTIEILDSDLNSLMKFNCLKAVAAPTIIMTNDFVVKGFVNKSIYMVLAWNIKTKKSYTVLIEPVGCLLELYLTSKNKLICRVHHTIFEVWDLFKESFILVFDTMFCDRFIFFTLNLYSRRFCARTRNFVRDSWFGRKRLHLSAATSTKLLYYQYNNNRTSKTWQIMDFEKNILQSRKPTTTYSRRLFLNVMHYVSSLIVNEIIGSIW